MELNYKVIDENYDFVILEFDLCRYSDDEIIKFVNDCMRFDYYNIYTSDDMGSDVVPVGKLHIELRGDYSHF